MPRRRNPLPVEPVHEEPPPITDYQPATPSTPVRPEGLLHLLGLLGLVAVALTVPSILSPFTLLAGAIFLLFPYRGHPFVRRSLVLAALLVALWAFNTLFSVLVPFLFAYLLAYIFDPMVTRLAARGVPRWAGSAGVVLIFVGCIAAVVIFVLPLAVVQFEGILIGVRTLLNQAGSWVQSGTIVAMLGRFGVQADSIQQLVEQQLVPRIEGILTGLVEGMLGLVSGITSVALHIINAIIIPFIVFYLLKDFPSISARFYQTFPAAHQERARKLMGRIDGVLGAYFRGASLVALIQGVIAAVVLSVIGVNYALVLGVMTAVLNFIPYVGLMISLVVASMVALFSGEPVVTKVIGVAVLYISQKLLEATVLGPKIIGPQVGLHPVVLILCLMVFGFFLGFVGLLIAVPATALLLLAWESVERKRVA
jgi:predicted PurR-regulated permease PerM